MIATQEKDISLDVIGIGNAIVDVLVNTSEEFIKSQSLQKGNMNLIDKDQANKLYQTIGKGIEASGGSAANTLAGITQLGGKGGFIGRVNDDELGEIFTRKIRSTGTIFETPPTIKGPTTASCLILVTPDAERTMCTYLGASTFLEPKDLDLDIIKEAKVLYLEGYLFDASEAKEAFYSAANIAKVNKRKVAISLSDSFCIDRHRESFLNLLNNYANIIFGNENEIISLTQSNNLNEAIKKVKDTCETVVITLGEKGSIILSKGEEIEIKSYSLGKAIDTTGAGDLYASGFLYGYINNYSLEKCGKIGSICAAHIVTVMGPNPTISLKKLVTEYL